MNRSSLFRGLAGSLALALPLVAGCRGEAESGTAPAPPTGEAGSSGGSGSGSAKDPANELANELADTPSPGRGDAPIAGGAGGAGADPAGAAAAGDPAPARTGNSRFAPGGEVADADLGKYYVEMTGAIDGEEVGTMTFEMWTEGAPITTRNFLRLVDEGFYDGLTFHRILRTFMIQGGDPTGTGGGNSPYGTIMAEFSNAPERRHGYGVLSMARLGHDENSASCQFFLCCDETQSVWGLDNKYTSFGRLTSGVETLEALASVPTKLRGREKSVPMAKVTIASARVVEGDPPRGETIARPMPAVDLGGEPEKVVVQHVLISFQGAGLPDVTRSKEEAEALANQVLERARAGESMGALARELSDDPVQEGDETPGVYRILNNGVRYTAGDRELFSIQQGFMAEIEAMQAEIKAGTLTQADFQTKAMARQTEVRAEMSEAEWRPRTGLVPAFGDIGFGLEVGEVGLATFDPAKSKYGFHIIKRLE